LHAYVVIWCFSEFSLQFKGFSPKSKEQGVIFCEFSLKKLAFNSSLMKKAPLQGIGTGLRTMIYGLCD